MEVLNSSSVPRVKFIVEDKNLIFAGISVSRSSSWPASGRLVRSNCADEIFFFCFSHDFASCWSKMSGDRI